VGKGRDWGRGRKARPSDHPASSSSSQDAAGGHDKKWLTLELHRVPPLGSKAAPRPLARGVVDLAAVAAAASTTLGPVALTLPLAACSGEAPAASRLSVAVSVAGLGRASEGGGDGDGGDAPVPPPPPPPRPPAPPPPPASDISSDGELLAAAAAAADDEIGAGRAAMLARGAPRAPSPLHPPAPDSDAATATPDASPRAVSGRLTTNPFASAASEASEPDAAGPGSGAASAPGAPTPYNPFVDDLGVAAESPPPPPPPVRTTAAAAPPPPSFPAPSPPRPGHARTPSCDLYLDGAVGVALPGETGFGSVAGRPRSGGRAPPPDPLRDAVEAAPPVDAIDMPPDAHDAVVGGGGAGRGARAASSSRPSSASTLQQPSRFAREHGRALIDEAGAAVAANRRYARRAAARRASSASPDSRGSPGESPVARHPATAALEAELLTAAALEACVYLPPPPDRSRPPSLHAPARRLARTIVSLGPGDGVDFGERAVAAAHAAARGGGGGLPRAARWWSAALQLRWMLWAMTHGGGDGDGGDEFGWAAAALAGPLRVLEASAAGSAVDGLWAALVAAAGAAAAGDVGRDRDGDGDAAAAAAEAAAARWLEGLRAARAALDAAAASVPPSHAALLRGYALGALMARLDGALFEELTREEEETGGPSLAPRPPSTRLPRSALPFDPDAPLTFTTGVALKLAASRLAHWAADAGARDPRAPLGPPPPASAFFPGVRAAADVLMVPKEALADEAVRRDVVPRLALDDVCSLLARFGPDAAAPDPLPPGLLDSLWEQGGEGGGGGGDRGGRKARPSSGASTPRRAPRAPPPYAPATEAALLDAGMADPVSLEQDADSGDDLADLAASVGGGGGGGGRGGGRFDLLRALWASAR